MNDHTFEFWRDLFALIFVGAFSVGFAVCVIGALVCIVVGAVSS